VRKIEFDEAGKWVYPVPAFEPAIFAVIKGDDLDVARLDANTYAVPWTAELADVHFGLHGLEIVNGKTVKRAGDNASRAYYRILRKEWEKRTEIERHAATTPEQRKAFCAKHGLVTVFDRLNFEREIQARMIELRRIFQ
jgi:hypothetical protein